MKKCLLCLENTETYNIGIQNLLMIGIVLSEEIQNIQYQKTDSQ